MQVPDAGELFSLLRLGPVTIGCNLTACATVPFLSALTGVAVFFILLEAIGLIFCKQVKVMDSLFRFAQFAIIFILSANLLWAQTELCAQPLIVLG